MRAAHHSDCPWQRSAQDAGRVIATPRAVVQEQSDLLHLQAQLHTEAVLDLGQQPGDRHRIEFGQVAEQAGIGGEAIGLAGLEAKHVGQDLAQLLVDHWSIHGSKG